MKHIIYNDHDINQPVILNCATVYRYYLAPVRDERDRQEGLELWYIFAELRLNYLPAPRPALTEDERDRQLYEPEPERILIDTGRGLDDGYRKLRKLISFLYSRKRVLDTTLAKWRA